MALFCLHLSQHRQQFGILASWASLSLCLSKPPAPAEQRRQWCHTAPQDIGRCRCYMYTMPHSNLAGHQGRKSPTSPKTLSLHKSSHWLPLHLPTAILPHAQVALPHAEEVQESLLDAVQSINRWEQMGGYLVQYRDDGKGFHIGAVVCGVQSGQ